MDVEKMRKHVVTGLRDEKDKGEDGEGDKETGDRNPGHANGPRGPRAQHGDRALATGGSR